MHCRPASIWHLCLICSSKVCFACFLETILQPNYAFVPEFDIVGSPGPLCSALASTSRMEALAAVGLAGNISQFVQYAAQLVSTGKETYKSASGSSERNCELEKIYGALSTFSSRLQKQATVHSHQSSTTNSLTSTHNPGNTEHVTALNLLTRDCKQVCDHLLGKIQELKVKDGRWRRCRSFRAALETVWDGKSISELESRLDRFQKIIMLHFFPIIRYCHHS